MTEATVQSQETQSKPRSPLFILGAPRSGTTILADALRKAGYAGFNEGHLLNVILPVKSAIEAHVKENRLDDNAQLLANLDVNGFINDVMLVFKQYQDKLNPTEPWFDKTPDAAMIYAAPVIAQLWPSAAFIFAKRRAIENIASRIKKFPTVAFKEHCAYWTASMEAWRIVKDSGIQGLEVDQFDIAHSPQREAARIGAYLNLDSAGVKAIIEEMTGSQPQRTDEESARRVLSLGTTGWTPQQIDLFKAYCLDEMEAYGYALDGGYRQSAASATGT